MSVKTLNLQSTDCYLHIYNRGVDRNTIFFRPSDYQYFIELMAGDLKGSELALVLYVLLPNHFHMVVKQASPYAISHFMKSVCEMYARYVNRLRARSGHLFQNRYKIDRIEDPGALLRISRYIHFNPVVAGLTGSYLEWMFGSGRIYAGVEASSFVTLEPILSLVGGCTNYIQFLQDYDPADPDSVWRYLVK